MKKNMIIAAAVLASAVACTKEVTVTEQPSADGKVQMSFAVSTEQTKTVLEGTNRTLWTGVEKLSIFDGESNNLFGAELTAPSATAQFTGKAKEAQTYYALYPYNSAAKLSGTTISTELPAAQTAAVGTFDPSAALLFGVSDGTSVTLKNLTAMLKLTVPANVTSIEVEGNGAALAGNVNLNVESAEVSGATATKVTLSGSGALEAGTYYIAVAPATVSGLSVKLIDSANSKYILRSVEASRTLAANTIYDMGDFSSLAWTSEGGDEPSGNDLVIFDNAFKTGYWSDNMTIESVDGQDCLKWVFKESTPSDRWANNYGTIKLDPALDFANFNADKAYLKFKFKVGVDNGPDNQHTLFRVYFNHSSKWDERVGAVGHNGATLEWYDAVVNDNEWHELALPLKDYVAKMTGDEAAKELGFSPLEGISVIGTTIYFKDISVAGQNGSSEPEQPTEDAQIIFDEAMQNSWVLGGTDGKYSIKDGVGKDGGKGIEWVLDASGSWDRLLTFELPANTDISEYTKFCFDLRYVGSTFAGGTAVFQNRMFGDGIELFYTMYAPSDDQWNTIEMPLTDFQFNKDVSGTKDWTKFKNFCFHTLGWYSGTATLYIDNVRLVK